MKIKELIKAIEAVDLKASSANDEIANLIHNNISKWPLYESVFKSGERMIRARKMSYNDRFYENTSDLIYPIDITKIKIGRANFPQQQVMYGARFRITAIAEVRFVYTNKETLFPRYTFGVWKATQPITLAAIVSAKSIRQNKTSELFGLADDMEKFEGGAVMTEEEKDIWTFYKYTAEKFMTPVQDGEEYKYKITAVIANFIFQNFSHIEGILYQSVQYPQYYNIAFRKDVIDSKKIHLETALRMRFKKSAPLNYSGIEDIQASNINNISGKITWF